AQLRMKDEPVQRERLVAMNRADVEMCFEQAAQKTSRGTQLAALDAMGQRVQHDQGVVATRLEHVDTSARGEHSGALIHEPLGLVQVVDEIAHQKVVEARVLERQLVDRGRNETTARKRLTREGDLLR